MTYRLFDLFECTVFIHVL